MTERDKGDNDKMQLRFDVLSKDVQPTQDLWPGIMAEIASENESEHVLKASASSEVAALPESIEPAADLWPSIESRIRADRQSTTSSWFGAKPHFAQLAACLALFAFVGFFAIEIYMRPGVIPQPIEDPVASGASEASQPEAAYFLPEARTPDGIAAQTVFNENIDLVQEQRAQIEASLELYPTDPALQRLWRQTYETELMLIDAAGRLLATI